MVKHVVVDTINIVVEGNQSIGNGKDSLVIMVMDSSEVEDSSGVVGVDNGEVSSGVEDSSMVVDTGEDSSVVVEQGRIRLVDDFLFSTLHDLI
jgi:hypothetical protein